MNRIWDYTILPYGAITPQTPQVIEVWTATATYDNFPSSPKNTSHKSAAELAFERREVWLRAQFGHGDADPEERVRAKSARKARKKGRKRK